MKKHTYEYLTDPNLEYDPIYEMPMLPAVKRATVTRLIPWTPGNSDRKGTLHFWIDDYKFDAMLTYKERYLDIIAQYDNIIQPDNSTYGNWNYNIQRGQQYIRQFIGAFWAYYGKVTVIPNIHFPPSNDVKWDFFWSGVPSRSIVAISGQQISDFAKDAESQLWFMNGVRELVKRCDPLHMIYYGGKLQQLEDEFGTILTRFTRHTFLGQKAVHKKITIAESASQFLTEGDTVWDKDSQDNNNMKSFIKHSKTLNEPVSVISNLNTNKPLLSWNTDTPKLNDQDSEIGLLFNSNMPQAFRVFNNQQSNDGTMPSSDLDLNNKKSISNNLNDNSKNRDNSLLNNTSRCIQPWRNRNALLGKFRYNNVNMNMFHQDILQQIQINKYNNAVHNWDVHYLPTLLTIFCLQMLNDHNESQHCNEFNINLGNLNSNAHKSIMSQKLRMKELERIWSNRSLSEEFHLRILRMRQQRNRQLQNLRLRDVKPKKLSSSLLLNLNPMHNMPPTTGGTSILPSRLGQQNFNRLGADKDQINSQKNLLNISHLGQPILQLLKIIPCQQKRNDISLNRLNNIKHLWMPRNEEQKEKKMLLKLKRPCDMLQMLFMKDKLHKQCINKHRVQWQHWRYLEDNRFILSNIESIVLHSELLDYILPQLNNPREFLFNYMMMLKTGQVRQLQSEQKTMFHMSKLLQQHRNHENECERLKKLKSEQSKDKVTEILEEQTIQNLQNSDGIFCESNVHYKENKPMPFLQQEKVQSQTTLHLEIENQEQNIGIRMTMPKQLPEMNDESMQSDNEIFLDKQPVTLKNRKKMTHGMISSFDSKQQYTLVANGQVETRAIRQYCEKHNIQYTYVFLDHDWVFPEVREYLLRLHAIPLQCQHSLTELTIKYGWPSMRGGNKAWHIRELEQSIDRYLRETQRIEIVPFFATTSTSALTMRENRTTPFLTPFIYENTDAIECRAIIEYLKEHSVDELGHLEMFRDLSEMHYLIAMKGLIYSPFRIKSEIEYCYREYEREREETRYGKVWKGLLELDKQIEKHPSYFNSYSTLLDFYYEFESRNLEKLVPEIQETVKPTGRKITQREFRIQRIQKAIREKKWMWAVNHRAAMTWYPVRPLELFDSSVIVINIFDGERHRLPLTNVYSNPPENYFGKI